MSLKVSAEDGRRLLDNLGYNVTGLQDEKLIRRLNTLPSLLEGGDELKEVDDLNLRDAILEALQQNQAIEMAGPGEATQLTLKVQKTVSTTAVLELPSGESASSSQSVSLPTESANGGSEHAKVAKGGKRKRQASTSTKSATGTDENTGSGSKGKGRRGTPSTAKIFDFSPAQVARWMGYHKFNIQEAQAVLSHFKVEVNPSSLRTYLTDGKREDEKFGKKAALSEEQASELLSIKAGLPSDPLAASTPSV